MLNEALSLELWLPPSINSFRYFFNEVGVDALCAAVRDWTITQIPS